MRFSLADKNLSLWLRLILPAVALVAAIAHFAIIHGQNAEQLSIYSAQSNYSVPLLDVKGLPYVGLVDLFEPLGDIEAKPDGKKYKLHFTPPGGHAVEAQFNEGKDKVQDSRRQLQASRRFRSAERPRLCANELRAGNPEQAAG